uniref:Immunoglobulin domain-containing protein n=1 Tax=Scleropages formosus TaxID=113540 RepID=A0A8C9RZ12_SCLFO
MAPILFLILLIYTSVADHCCLRTFQKLTAKSGTSITIPCFYDQKYKRNVKYWCKGERQESCTTMIRTDYVRKEGQVSITDDPKQLVFTVTMKNLERKDSDWYWCGVKTGGGAADKLAYLYLKVTRGAQRVRTKSWISAERGASVTIPCHYDLKYKNHVKYWCKGETWAFCSTMVRTDSPQKKGDVSITDNPNLLVFIVIMRNLQEKDSDTYWCAVEIDGGSDDGVILPLMIRDG